MCVCVCQIPNIRLPPQSESSGGGITTDGSASLMDTYASMCLSITGDIPYRHQEKQKASSILSFAQKKPSSGSSRLISRSSMISQASRKVEV